MHVVRNCSSTRCKFNQHAHSYSVDIVVSADYVDNGQMLMDFGLFKQTFGQFIKMFDKSYTVWNKESLEFKQSKIRHYDRIVELPVSPSAEMLSVVMFYVIDKIFKNTKFNNGEKDPELLSVKVHETLTGNARSYRADAERLYPFTLEDIKFSDAIDQSMWNDLLAGKQFVNAIVEQQVI